VWEGGELAALNMNGMVQKQNIWGRPPHEKVVETKHHNYYKRMIKRVAVPLGEGEWDLLRDLAQGKQNEAEWKIPCRRAKATTQDDAPTWDWEQHVLHPPSKTEKPTTMSQVRRNGLQGLYTANIPSRELPERWFRRTYDRMWHTTPKMIEDPKTRKTEYTWGDSKKIPVASASQMDIFENVPADTFTSTKKGKKGKGR
jgi:hypothetical protein